MLNLKQKLINKAEDVAAATGFSLSTLGARYADKGDFFARLMRGSSVTIDKYEAVMKKLSALEAEFKEKQNLERCRK